MLIIVPMTGFHPEILVWGERGVSISRTMFLSPLPRVFFGWKWYCMIFSELANMYMHPLSPSLSLLLFHLLPPPPPSFFLFLGGGGWGKLGALEGKLNSHPPPPPTGSNPAWWHVRHNIIDEDCNVWLCMHNNTKGCHIDSCFENNTDGKYYTV